MIKTLLTHLLLLLTLTAHAQLKEADVSNIKNKFLDIPYASLSDAEKLDIYLPDEGKGPFPVILSIHGGGFMAGDKRDPQVTPMLRGLERGYAVVSINYRLSGEATWPAQIYDCKASVRWVRAHATKYNLNPQQIVAWGGSAGGQLSAMLGTSGGVSKLEGADLGNANQSSRVQAVVDWFGPTDFLKMDKQLQASGVKKPMHHSVADSPESLLLGHNLQDVPDLVKEADPGTYVSPDDPPFLIQHGTEDSLVPYQGSVLLARQLGKQLGSSKVSLELFPATGHGNGPAFYTWENFNRIFAFIDTYLKNNRPASRATDITGKIMPEKGFIRLDGCQLHYVIEGKGTPCLVIGSSVYYPRTFSQNLQKHLKMYFVDMRWFAPKLDEMTADSFTIRQVARDIEQVRKYFGLKEPVIMGHSIHGSVAMEYAKRYPNKSSGVVMIGSPNFYGNKTYDQATEKVWEGASEERKKLQIHNWTQLEKIRDQFTDAQLIVENYCAMSPKYWNNPRYDGRWLWKGVTIHAGLVHQLYGRLFSNYSMFGTSTDAPVPTLVLMGRHDYAVPTLLWEKDMNIKNLTVEVLDRSGHTPQLEQPDEFDNLLLNWIDKNQLNHE